MLFKKRVQLFYSKTRHCCKHTVNKPQTAYMPALNEPKPQWHTPSTSVHVEGPRTLFYLDPKPCLSLNQPRRSSKMSPVYKKKTQNKSALATMKAAWHIAQKQAHLLTLEHTVNTCRAGSTSCRVHGLEMRNMIHFLSMLDSHASTVHYNEIQQFEQLRGKVLNMTYGLDSGKCVCWVTRCHHNIWWYMLTAVLILCSWSRSKIRLTLKHRRYR